ncbi:MAG: tRNA-splicing endonuclease [Candidatus Heimdallarchaeota archaeon LC_3]|nr:MAG: tRNA-splicing endonuclease [Candidatus Heimdallarchaeota archaeon LC_3]
MSDNDYSDKNDSKKQESPPEIIGLFVKPNIHIYGENKFYYYESGYYGNKSEDFLELSFEEALLLAERGRIRIFSNEDNTLPNEGPISNDKIQLLTELDVTSLTQIITREVPNFWGRYLVYKDLRSRGYVVRPGYGSSSPYRRYPRGTKAEKSQSNALIYPFIEGTKIELFELERLEESAHANRKTLILGIVDRSGDVTYYKTSEFELNENKEIYEWHDEDSQRDDKLDNENDSSNLDTTIEGTKNE